ncbi:hypothetical protein AB0I81_00645 [Nonomuraea sp. NPDC050404]|uniref:hypothetical protein n=1 Tax=Nonomuraea sp. NPDC050404 TaxID=3155783 RepID=UPI0033EF6FBE
MAYEFGLVTGVLPGHGDKRPLVFFKERAQDRRGETTAADDSVTPARWPAKQIKAGNPDLLRSLVKTMAEPLPFGPTASAARANADIRRCGYEPRGVLGL